MTTVRDLITHLQRAYAPEDTVAVAIWHPKDVQWRAEDREIEITHEIACDIIVRLDNTHDAELGINWATIDFWLDELSNGGAS